MWNKKEGDRKERRKVKEEECHQDGKIGHSWLQYPSQEDQLKLYIDKYHCENPKPGGAFELPSWSTERKTIWEE